MTNAIDNTADILDSRDIIERIEALESELIDAKDDESESSDLIDLEAWLENAANDENHVFQEAAKELLTLKALADEGENLSDWKYGETLIRDSYFKTYAEELASDIGAINANATWPNNCIDWERAARELQQDYTSIEFDGVTYWARG